MCSYKHNAKSPLLRLPGELRNCIYEYAVGSNQVMSFVELDSSYYELEARPYEKLHYMPRDKNWNEIFNLKLVCKALRKETKTLPYHLNILLAPRCAPFDLFLEKLKPECAEAIRTVSFGARDVSAEDTVPHSIKKCTGLITVICMNTLCRDQVTIVMRFAKEDGLDIMYGKHDFSPFEYYSKSKYSSDSSSVRIKLKQINRIRQIPH